MPGKNGSSKIFEALSAFFAFIALYIIYQALYIYLYSLRSEYNQLVVERIFIMIRIGNASQIRLFSTNLKSPQNAT